MKYYVYEWIRLDTNEPFYVGKGKGNRAFVLTRANNHHFNRIVNKYPVAVHILEEELTEMEAYQIECWYIHEYRDVIGYNLTNLTDGGEGVTLVGENNPMYGRPWWNENTPLEKIENWKKSCARFGESNGNYRRIYTEEQILKMKKAKEGKYLGKHNPNYGNDTLKKKYEQNPELKKLLARKGTQNGNSKAVRMFFESGEFMDFDYMTLCAEWLISNQYTKAKPKSVVDNITVSIKRNKKYLGFKFKVI